jgi:L-asparagine transporter-like permease
MASSLVWGPALWVFAKSRQKKRAMQQGGLPVPEATSDGTKPTFMASLDKAADVAADSVSLTVRRTFVNGLCLAAVCLPILAIADMSLPKTANVTLAILSVCLSVGLWRLASVIEKDYTEDDELRDEVNALSFRLFIKRLVNWGIIIFGLVGVGYLIAAMLYGDSLS